MIQLNQYLRDYRLVAPGKRVYYSNELDLNINTHVGTFSNLIFLKDGTIIEDARIQPYTGFKDLYGNKIYADDIVQLLGYDPDNKVVNVDMYTALVLNGYAFLKPIDFVDEDDLTVVIGGGSGYNDRAKGRCFLLPFNHVDSDTHIVVIGNRATWEGSIEALKAMA